MNLAAARAPKRFAPFTDMAMRTLDTHAKALLFAAARARHVDKCQARRSIAAAGAFRPVRRQSLAYQGGAGELGIEQVRAVKRLRDRPIAPRTTRSSWALAEGGARARARDNEDSDRIGAGPKDITRRSISPSA